MGREYLHRGHTVTDIKFHFVWVTKYRYPVLTGEVGTRVRDLVREILCCPRNYGDQWSCIEGSCAPLGGLSTPVGTIEDYEMGEGGNVAEGTDGVSAPEEAILGPALLGTRLFLCELRHGDG